MNHIVKSVYIICSMLWQAALLCAAIVKPEWWGAFLFIAFLGSWGFTIRLDDWEKSETVTIERTPIRIQDQQTYPRK